VSTITNPAHPPRNGGIVVEVSDTQNFLAVDSPWVEQLVERTLRLEGVDQASISVALVDDASIRVINARHLSHDWATDVISFRLSDDGDEELSGELIISTQMAWKTAAEAQSPPSRELALYLVHGLLHLCGYDDQAADDVAVIRRREEAVLDALGIDYPLSRVDRCPATSDDSGRESSRWPR